MAATAVPYNQTLDPDVGKLSTCLMRQYLVVSVHVRYPQHTAILAVGGSVAWTAFFAQLAPDERDAVQAALEHWAQLDPRWKRIATSLADDTKIPKRLVRKLGRIIAATPAPHLLAELRSFSQRHTLEGKQASKVHFPLIRVTKFSWLAETIQKQAAELGDPWTEADVADVMFDLLDSRRWVFGVQRLLDAGIRMSRWAAWATFPLNGATPLHEMTAIEIACDLGFDEGNYDDPWPNPEPLLLMTYNPPRQQTDLRIPTTIEALASDPLNYYFTPGLPGSTYGWTQPWANKAHAGSRSRPEIVHKSLPFGLLIEPVRDVY